MNALTESEVKLVKKLEREERRLRINYLCAVCWMIVCLAVAILGFAMRDRGLVWLGSFAFLSAELLLISVRNNSRHYRLIKKLMGENK